MAQRNQHNSDSMDVPFGFGTFAVVNGSLANAMAHNRTMFERSLRAWQEETLRFINRRLEENASALEGCQECESLADLMALQQKWFAHAVVDLYDESARLGETMHKLLAEKAEEANAETVSSLRKPKRHTEHHQEAA